MPSTEHLEILKSGQALWNEWRESNPSVVPDFSWSNMPGLDLSGYNMANANLKLAFCKGCDFSKADFSNCNLYGANLEKANASGCNFNGTNFEGALIKDAVFVNTLLTGCNFRLSNIEGTNFEGADFTDCKKLKSDQLKKALSLYNAILGGTLEQKIRDEVPNLFIKTNP